MWIEALSLDVLLDLTYYAYLAIDAVQDWIDILLMIFSNIAGIRF